MRVLYFTPFFTLRNTSSDTYLTNEVKSTIQEFPDVEFLVYVVNQSNKKVLRYSDKVLQVNRKSYKKLLFMKDMIKIFTKFKPQVIHSHYAVPSIIISLFSKIFKVPLILHGRGMDFTYFPYISIKSRIILFFAGKLSNKVLTVSKSMRDDCLRFKIPNSKIQVLYNGVDFERFKMIDKKYFNHSCNRPLELLNIGTLSIRKRQRLIIEACRKLKNNQIKFHLKIIGEGEQKEILEELINRYGLKDCIDMIGLVDHNDLPDHINGSDLFVLPSKAEGLPNAVLEAMSMELVVIMTKTDGNVEIAQDVGSILIKVDDVEGITNAIIHYYKNPEDIKKGGGINRNFIVNTFSWDKHAKELYQVYNFLANKGKITD